MNRLPDPRCTEQSVYAQAHLLWLGILLFLMHLGSRRQMRFERLADEGMAAGDYTVMTYTGTLTYDGSGVVTNYDTEAFRITLATSTPGKIILDVRANQKGTVFFIR